MLDRLRTLYGVKDFPGMVVEYANAGKASRLPEVHWMGALGLQRLYKWHEASRAIELAASLPSSGELAVKIAFHQGMINRQVGQLLISLSAFERCLELLTECPSLAPVLRGVILFNRAAILEYTSNKHLALPTYQDAAGEFRQEGMKDYLRMALQNMVWVACEQGDAELAATALDEASPLCLTEDAQWTQKMVNAFLLHVSGKHTDALRICELLEVGDGVPVDVHSLGSSIAARIALALGLFSEAEAMAKQAIHHSIRSDADSRCFIVASKVLVAIRQTKVRSETGV